MESSDLQKGRNSSHVLKIPDNTTLEFLFTINLMWIGHNAQQECGGKIL